MISAYQFTSSRRAFTLKELLIVIGAVGLLCALFLPQIQEARETARRNRCQSNLKQIALALLNYEDKQRCFPPISTNLDSIADIPGDVTATTDSENPEPGTAPSKGAGYSWWVLLLPEMECGSQYQSIVKTSKDFTESAFSPTIQVDPASGGFHPAAYDFVTLHCPSFSGGTTLDISPRTVGVAGGAVETGTIPPNYVGGVATAGGAKGCTISNYAATLGTHIDTVADKDFPARSASLKNSNNGAMLFRGTAFNRGRSLASISDGISRTSMVAETRERRFASWYDGTMNWVVAARHSLPTAGTTAIVPANNGTNKVDGQTISGRWVVGTDGTSATGGSALNYGPTRANPTAVYLPTAALADPEISGIPPGRLWGPSSEHPGRIVNHVFCDGHVQAVSDNIDPNIYLWFFTYKGQEAAVTERVTYVQ